MNNQRVLIVTVPKQDIVRPPGILGILGACCETVGADYQVFDLNLHMYKTLLPEDVVRINADFSVNQFRNTTIADQYSGVCQKLIDLIDSYRPTLVAISIFTDHSVLACDHLLKLLNSTCTRPQYKIVVGGIGSNCTSYINTQHKPYGAWCLESGSVDYHITGEGELSFVELLKNNLDYPGINGRPSEQILDLDLVPTPSYKKINPGDYYFSDAPEVVITGSKGCVRDCSFCDVGVWWKRYVYRSGSLIADDIYKIYKETGVKKFDFSDSLINGSIKEFRQFNKRLIELKKQDPAFSIEYKGQFICRPIGQMKSQDYSDMKEAGAQTLVVGIEHFSEHIRTHMRKHFDNSAIDWHFEQCARLGIKNVLLLLSGYVTETLDDHLINLHYLERYQKYALSRIIFAVNLAVSGLAIIPGSPLHEMANEIGIEWEGDEIWDWNSATNPGLTAKERLRRGVETFSHAVKLNYSILHFDQTVADLERKYLRLKDSKSKILIPISSASTSTLIK